MQVRVERKTLGKINTELNKNENDLFENQLK